MLGVFIYEQFGILQNDWYKKRQKSIWLNKIIFDISLDSFIKFCKPVKLYSSDLIFLDYYS